MNAVRSVEPRNIGSEARPLDVIDIANQKLRQAAAIVDLLANHGDGDVAERTIRNASWAALELIEDTRVAINRLGVQP